MGLSFSPDTAQETMEDLFQDMDKVDCCINNAGVFDNSWEAHHETLPKALRWLQDNSFICNPLKCNWGAKETNWSGCWLTPTGL